MCYLNLGTPLFTYIARTYLHLMWFCAFLRSSPFLALYDSIWIVKIAVPTMDFIYVVCKNKNLHPTALFLFTFLYVISIQYSYSQRIIAETPLLFIFLMIEVRKKRKPLFCFVFRTTLANYLGVRMVYVSFVLVV